VIRVLLADDQALVRSGFRMILEARDDLEVVGEAEDGADAVALARSLRPDAILMDVRMPRLDGIEATQQIVASGSPARVLILTTYDLDEYVYAAIRAGASGFLLKDVEPAQLVDAVRVVAGGGTAVKPIVSRRVVRGLESAKAEFPRLEPPDPLTGREIEVLRLMTGGYSNREIARALNVAEGTIKNHVSSILSKLGVRDRTRAVLQAVRAGYL